jgi:hypothetical protein
MRRIAWRVLTGMLLLAVMAGVASAQGGYTLGRYSAEHSGAVATGGGYTLVGATGQADAGRMGGGSFTLAGGFLSGSADGSVRELYMPRLGR